MAGMTSTSNPNSTMIVNPTSGIHQGEQGMGAGAAQGAATGAAAGASVGSVIPVVGTAVGAVVGGVIGGVVGAISGAFADRGKFHERKANKWIQLGKERSASVQIRDAVNQFRQNRAMQMAAVGAEVGGNQSSAPAGAVGSYGSQFVFGMNFNQGQAYIERQAAKQLKRAGKNYNSSKMGFAYLDAAASIAGSFGGAFGSAPSSAPAAGNTFGFNGSSPSSISTPQAFSGPRY